MTWHDPKENKPEDGEDALVFCVTWELAEYAIATQMEGRWVDTRTGRRIEDQDVTHWARLPSAPGVELAGWQTFWED